MEYYASQNIDSQTTTTLLSTSNTEFITFAVIMLRPHCFLLLLATAAQSKYVTNPQPICKDIKLSLTATAENFALPRYPDSTAPTAVGQYLTSFNASTIPQNHTVSGTFSIAATYCEPANKVPDREGTVQLLLHGLGYTKVRACLNRARRNRELITATGILVGHRLPKHHLHGPILLGPSRDLTRLLYTCD